MLSRGPQVNREMQSIGGSGLGSVCLQCCLEADHPSCSTQMLLLEAKRKLIKHLKVEQPICA